MRGFIYALIFLLIFILLSSDTDDIAVFTIIKLLGIAVAVPSVLYINKQEV